MVHIHTQGAFPHPRCLSTYMLRIQVFATVHVHVHVRSACLCPCPFLVHVHVYVHIACPCPSCMSVYLSMMHVHVICMPVSMVHVYCHRWTRLLKQQSSIAVYRPLTKENKRPFFHSVCSKQTLVCRFRFPFVKETEISLFREFRFPYVIPALRNRHFFGIRFRVIKQIGIRVHIYMLPF
jgi:hypothetical protein